MEAFGESSGKIHINHIDINTFPAHYLSHLYVLVLDDTCLLHLLKSYSSFKVQLLPSFLCEVFPDIPISHFLFFP